ncbi:MAG TPA: hypothetical protein VGQ18_01090 [Gemmatimonadales bacterium]|jgi:citrate lyase beta subunit|nr:hypothetical protein [Gemmatimonadales bacterium]
MRPLLAVFVFAPAVLAAQAPLSVPSDTLIAGITERGRFLAAYDQAAWFGTDALLLLHPDPAGGNTMLARRGSGCCSGG